MNRATHYALSVLGPCALALWGCGSPSEHGSGHGSGHDEDQEHAHAHEDRHDEVPRTVTLSSAVVEAAGIQTAAANQRVLRPTVRLPGEIQAHPDHQATVAARIDGVVESVEVQTGDSVKKGDVLARLRAPNLQSLRASASSLGAKAASARANADRLEGLVAKRMASEQEVVAAKADAHALQAEARAARERLRSLGLGRGAGGSLTFDVHAPIDGLVLERNAVVGAPVTPETAIAKLVSAREVWFIGHLFERDVARVETQSHASVRLNAYPDDTFEGQVEYIAHQVDPGARTLSARIPLANPDGKLRLGLFGTAHVIASGEPSEPVLAVPNSAVTRMAGKPVVFVRHDDAHFEVHEVVVGKSDTQFTEIVHGVREGEQVVIEGAFTVKSVLLRDSFGEDHH